MEQLLNVLKGLRDNPQTINKKVGLCTNVMKHVIPMCRGSVDGQPFIDKFNALLKKYAKLNRTSDNFPVPGGCSAYYTAMRDGNLWDKSSEYGMERWKLLHWMIDELESSMGQDD